MAASGAKVLQLRSVEFARNHGVRLHVRSTFSAADGTWVTEEDERMLEKAMISGVTHTLEETLYRVEGVAAARLFTALAEAQVNVDTIVQTGREIVFSAPVEDREDAARALDGARRLVDRERRARQGERRRRGHEVATPASPRETFSTLAELGIEPQVVTTSPIKIACHVSRDDVERAVPALHEAFELERPEAVRAHA